MSDRFGAGLTVGGGDLDARARSVIGAHESRDVPRLERLWAYYRNPLEPVGREGTARASASGARRNAGSRIV